jgi:hypothetical protein
MHSSSRKRLFGAALLSLCLAAPLGCEKTRADTKTPVDERGGAGADGNNSAPASLSNGGADPEKTDLTEPSTDPEKTDVTAPGTNPPPGDASSPPPPDAPSSPPPK